MSSVEDITSRLAEIHDLLAALPKDAFAERFALAQEQDALRQKAKEFLRSEDSKRSTDRLRSELESLLKRRRLLVESRTGYVIIEGETSLFAPSAWVKLTTDAKKSAGVDVLDVRVSQIRDELARREQTGSEPNST